MPWERARQLAHAAPRVLPPSRVPPTDATGRTLAEDLCTPQPMPGFDTAAMDGYAVGPGAGPWRVRGVVRAGDTWTDGPLEVGEAVEISTGAHVPEGARAVVPVEQTERTGTLVHGPGRGRRQAHPPCRRGRPGRCIAGPGRHSHRPRPAGPGRGLRPRHPSRTAPPPRPDPGHRRRTDPHRPSRPGRVRGALGPLLPPLVQALGGETTEVHHVPDRPHGSLATAVRTLPYGGPDVTVVTGSTSVGVTDQLRMLLADAGARWVVDAVACRPGHPQLLAQLPDGHWVVGLPGNPYAALVAAHTLLAPLLAGLTGRPLPTLPRIPLTGDIRTAPGRTRLIPVAWDDTTAHPVGGHRPAFLHGAALADALAAVPPYWQPGDAVPLILLTT